MSMGSTGPTGPSNQAQINLVSQINSDSTLTLEQKQALVTQANGINLPNNLDPNDPNALNNPTVAAYNQNITDTQSQYNAQVAARQKLLTTTRATLGAQFQALIATPGSAQTTNLTALSTPQVPQLPGTGSGGV